MPDVRRTLPPVATPGVNPCWELAKDNAGSWVLTTLSVSGIGEQRKRRRSQGYRFAVRDGAVWVRWQAKDATPS